MRFAQKSQMCWNESGLLQETQNVAALPSTRMSMTNNAGNRKLAVPSRLAEAREWKAVSRLWSIIL